jgi:putative hydrolase of the HAD superfamily
MKDRDPCLVFDLDDTLYLEREYVRSGFEAVGHWAARHLGISDFGERAWRLFEGGRRSVVFDVLLRESGWNPSPMLIAQMVEVYRTHSPRISAPPDAIDCLSSFHGTGILALISDGPPTSQQLKLRALKLEQFFEIVVFTGVWDQTFAKPHARSFQLVQARLAPCDKRFIYIADNPRKDFIAPAALGWKTVRVRRPNGLHAHVDAPPGAGADVEMEDLSGLRDFVYRNAAQL